jgi:hypothetical protein
MTSSHMGQDIKDHVILRPKGAIDFDITTFERISPDGSRTDFEIPSDRYLVITDVEWQVGRKKDAKGLATLELQSGDAVWIEIRVLHLDSVMFSSRTVNVLTDGLVVGTSEQLTTGFTVGPGRISARARVSTPQAKGAVQWGVQGF